MIKGWSYRELAFLGYALELYFLSFRLKAFEEIQMFFETYSSSVNAKTTAETLQALDGKGFYQVAIDRDLKVDTVKRYAYKGVEFYENISRFEEVKKTRLALFLTVNRFLESAEEYRDEKDIRLLAKRIWKSVTPIAEMTGPRTVDGQIYYYKTRRHGNLKRRRIKCYLKHDHGFLIPL